MSVTKWWICEGWTEQTFTIYPNKSIGNVEEPLHIHFDYNHFEPELMILQSDGSYSYTTMWPPGKVAYFFTVDKIVTYASDHPKMGCKFGKIVENIEHYDEIKSYKLLKFHYRILTQGQVLNDLYKSCLKTCIPRPNLPKYVKPEIEKERDPWLFETSLFAKYIQDNEKLIAKWFEFDWGMMQTPKFTPGKLMFVTILFVNRARKWG